MQDRHYHLEDFEEFKSPMQIENREGLEFNYFEESKLMPVAGLHNLDDDILDDELEDAD